jgi:hypothetical protein
MPPQGGIFLRATKRFPQPVWMACVQACGKVPQPTDGIALRTRCENFRHAHEAAAGEKTVAQCLESCICHRDDVAHA